MEIIANKKLHYVKVPENHIVIDFDIKDEELSKSGQSIHLHYIYTGLDKLKNDITTCVTCMRL